MTLIAHWPLVSGAESPTGSDYNLTANGSPTFAAQVPRGGAVTLNGTDQYLSLTNSTALAAIDGETTGSIGAWIKTSAQDAAQCIFSMGDKDSPSNYCSLRTGPVTSVYSDESLSFIVQTGGVVRLRMHVRRGHNFLHDGKWHHVAVTIGANGFNTIYIDGENQVSHLTFQTGTSSSGYLTNFSNADLLTIGAWQVDGTARTNYFNGQIADVRVYSEPQFLTATNNYRFDNEGGCGFRWGAANTGDYTLADAEITTIQEPSTGTAVEGDLGTWAYRHHTAAYRKGGITYVAHSIGAQNEDADAQHSILWRVRTTPSGPNILGPDVLVPPQSDFSATAPSRTTSYVLYPNYFAETDGRLFLISDLTIWDGSNIDSIALIARECGPSGPIGSPFRITSPAYTPDSGYSQIAYDATLGPPLLAQDERLAHWQGSGPNAALSYPDWNSAGQLVPGSGVWYTEPAKVALDSDRFWYRLWRRVDTATGVLYSQWSEDEGATWLPATPVATEIPNSPSAPYAVTLGDGRVALIGNPEERTNGREPLYLAISDASGVNFSTVQAIVQGNSGGPVYAGTSKSEGYAYAGAAQAGNYLHVSYSRDKEKVVFARVLIPGLADDDGDYSGGGGLLRRGNLSGIIGTPLAGKF